MSGGSMDYAYRRVLDVLESEGWQKFARAFPGPAAQVRAETVGLAAKLKAIEWDTSGDGSWHRDADETAVTGYLWDTSTRAIAELAWTLMSEEAQPTAACAFCGRLGRPDEHGRWRDDPDGSAFCPGSARRHDPR